MACAPRDNAAHFTLASKSSLNPDCFEQAFPLDAKIITARNSENTLSLVFQSAVTNFQQTNSILIEVYQPDKIRENLAQSTAISPPGTLDALVSAKVTLFAACPDILNSFYLDGNIIFTELENGKNAHIAGTITDARILNARTHQPVADNLSGSWDFTVEPGQPAQHFYAFP